MRLITTQVYIKMNRVIEENQQKNIAHQQVIELYEDRISTNENSFLLSEVLDISYKSSSTNFGTLYLHTNQGLFPYHIETEPGTFLVEFKKLKHNYS
ncbi:hypothetical protein [Litchfieldia alkalitelluris]|uniref:hypothetical protein n=1 Tax=Litchfieldia alkalitelluris TaxID=304268 RepID=UPI0009969D69|nr:hypothetical protein [Litchfieldia alkalitelluris]